MASTAENTLIATMRRNEKERCAAICDAWAEECLKNENYYLDSVAHAMYLAAKGCADIIRKGNLGN